MLHYSLPMIVLCNPWAHFLAFSRIHFSQPPNYCIWDWMSIINAHLVHLLNDYSDLLIELLTVMQRSLISPGLLGHFSMVPWTKSIHGFAHVSIRSAKSSVVPQFFGSTYCVSLARNKACDWRANKQTHRVARTLTVILVVLI